VSLITQINAEKSARIRAICGKLKFRPGLPCDPSNIQIVQAVITIAFYSSFFLEKKDQKFKPALRRMLKHRKNVALHAQFFARLRYWQRRADTNYLSLCNHST
jgi:hypothetical protein